MENFWEKYKKVWKTWKNSHFCQFFLSKDLFFPLRSVSNCTFFCRYYSNLSNVLGYIIIWRNNQNWCLLQVEQSPKTTKIERTPQITDSQICANGISKLFYMLKNIKLECYRTPHTCLKWQNIFWNNTGLKFSGLVCDSK